MRGSPLKLKGRHRALLRLPLFLLLLALTVVLLLPVQRRIDAFSERLQEQTISRLESAIGRELSYDSISPSILLFLEIRGIRVNRLDEGRNLELESIRIHYSLPTLLRGDIGEAVESVTVMDTTLRIDSRKDAALLEELRRMLRRGGAGEDGGLSELVLNGENIHIRYAAPEGTVHLRELFFSGHYDEERDRYMIEGRGLFEGQLQRPLQMAEFSVSRGRSRFSFRSTASRSFRRLNARLSLQQFESDLLSFSGLTIEIERERQRTVVRKIEDSSPWDLQFVLDQRSETLTGSIAAEEFVPADNIRAESGLETYAPWLGSTVSGTARVVAGLDGTLRRYRGDLLLALDNAYIPEPLTVEVKASGGPEEVRFEQLRVEGRTAKASFSGRLALQTLLPTGTLDIERFRWKQYRFAGSLRLLSDGRSLTAAGDRITINGLELREFRSTLQLTQQQAEFDLSTQVTSIGDSGEGGTIRGQGSYAAGPSQFLDVSMTVSRVSLVPVAQAAFPEGLPKGLSLSGLEISSEVFFSTDFDRYSFSLLPLRVSGRDTPFSFQAAVSGNSESVLAEQISLETGERSFRGRLRLSNLRNGALTFGAELTHRANTYSLEGSYRRPSTILVKGNHGLRMTAFLRDGGVTFDLRASNYPLPLGDGEETTELSLSASGSYRSPSDWQVQAREIRAVNLPQLGESSTLSFSAAAVPGRVEVSRMLYTDPISTLRGEAELTEFSTTPLGGRLWFRLRSEDGEETYRGTASMEDGDLQGRVALTDVPLIRLRDVPVNGFLDLSLELRGSRSNPRVDYSVQLRDGRYKAASLAFSGKGRVDSEIVTVRDFDFEYRSHLFNDARAELRLPDGDFLLKGDYTAIMGKRSAQARVDCEGRIHGIESLQNLAEAADKEIEAEMRLSGIRLFGKEHDPWELSFRKRENMQLRGGPEDSLRAMIRPDGRFDFSLRDPLPLRMEGEGFLRENELNMQLRNMWIRLSTFNTIGFEAVDFSSGIITGNMRIQGPSGDPEFFGDLAVRNAAGKVKYVKNPVRPFSTAVSISGKTGTVEPVEARSGKQRVRLSGALRFDRWTPNSVRIDVRTLSQKGVEMDFVLPASGLIARGYTRGTFSYSLDGKLSQISGNMVISDFTVTMQDKKPPTLEQEKELQVDLVLRTGKNVQFLWPRANFPILRAYVDTEQKLSIRYRSDPERYSIRGDIEVRGGELYYVQRNFYLTEGAIHLNEDETGFNPLVEMRAQIREIDNTGQPVTIYLIVENEPLKSFTPRFESQPVLGTAEIMQLLGAQLYSQFGSERADITSALMLTGDVVSQFGLIRNFEQQVKDTLRLDLFSVRTQMIQNVILDRVLDQPVTEGAEQLSPAERYLDNTTLFLGKYLGNDLFLEGMVQLRRNPILENDIDESTPLFENKAGEGGLEVHMEIGFEWQTPLFLLNFSINPDFRDPVQSIYNTSLGFSWDYSY